MNTGLENRTVLVTGASGSLGRSIAEAFGEEGARLILQGRSRTAELEEYVAGRPWSSRARVITADLSRPDALVCALDAVLGDDERLDHVIANAGHWPSEPRPLHRIDEERFLDTLQSNLMGAVRTARYFMARLERLGGRPGEGASLTFTGSTAARFGERDHSDYAAAKAALVGLARTLKNEITRIDPLARVNVIEPGWSQGEVVRPELQAPGIVSRVTRTLALRQLGRGKDVARAAVFLASPVMARHVTGEVLGVHGGMEGRVLWSESDIDEAAVMARLAEDAPDPSP